MDDLQKEIVERMKVQPTIDVEEEIDKTVNFMVDYALKHDFVKSYVLGISGGQDSTLLGYLAQKACEILNEKYNREVVFIAVRLPYGEQLDEDEAMDAVKWMDADRLYTVNIKGAVDAQEKSLNEAGLAIGDFNKGNIKARQRMIVQYAIAGENSGVVLGSDQSAENLTGFFTKHGDGGSDINPLFRLNKRQGRQMLEYLGAPKHLYEKVPTADLEDDKPGLSDEDKLGVSYQAIDDYLEGKEVAKEDKNTIENWYIKTEHKRNLPITIFDDFWK